MIKLRVHHIFDFVQALISEDYKKKYLNPKDQANGCYTKKMSEGLEKMLDSVKKNTKVRIVLEKDDICKLCDYKKTPKWNESCSFEDSVWDCKELLAKVTPGEIVTIEYLKNQYSLYQKYKDSENHNWKKIIYQSRKKQNL